MDNNEEIIWQEDDSTAIYYSNKKQICSKCNNETTHVFCFLDYQTNIEQKLCYNGDTNCFVDFMSESFSTKEDVGIRMIIYKETEK